MHTVAVVLLLTARIYSNVDVPAGDRGAATHVAAQILRSAGIDILWMDCNDRVTAAGPAAHPACTRPPNQDEVIVRFVSSPALNNPRTKSGADSLGDAYVDTAAARGSLATVYVDRVAAMARASGVDAGTLLGRVAAHEIGHLLLGTSAHRTSGLMRAQWSTTLLQRRMPNDWLFSSRDAASVREGALKRVRPVPAPASDSTAATVPCAAPLPATCPSCPVCVTVSPADRMPFHLLVEPSL